MDIDPAQHEDMPKAYRPERHLDKKIYFMLWIYFVIAVILLLIAFYHIIADSVDSAYPMLGLLVGIVGGVAVSRIMHISWDKDARRAISRLDFFGIVILILYFIFEDYRESIFAYFVQGPAVVATTFAFFAGTMIGRLIGMRGKIVEVVSENLKQRSPRK